jgi:hypothetical protein
MQQKQKQEKGRAKSKATASPGAGFRFSSVYEALLPFGRFLTFFFFVGDFFLPAVTTGVTATGGGAEAATAYVRPATPWDAPAESARASTSSSAAAFGAAGCKGH